MVGSLNKIFRFLKVSNKKKNRNKSIKVIRKIGIFSLKKSAIGYILKGKSQKFFFFFFFFCIFIYQTRHKKGRQNKKQYLFSYKQELLTMCH